MELFPKQVPEDCALVVVIDAGSNQEADMRTLYEQGKEVLIIDHHHPEQEVSTGVLVNNQIGGYGNPWLSGAGVLYKFLQVYDEKYVAGEGYADSQLDLVALSLISDMMNLEQLREPLSHLGRAARSKESWLPRNHRETRVLYRRYNQFDARKSFLLHHPTYQRYRACGY